MGVKKSPEKRKQVKPGTYKIVKRTPNKYELGERVIYVHSRSNVKYLIRRITKLIHQDANDFVIYGLGAAIRVGIVLALELTKTHPSFSISTHTFTTQLTDDLEPISDDVDFDEQYRLNSGIRIDLTREPM